MHIHKEARSKSMRQPKLSDMSQSAMIQTNWKFVETLLQEVKTKVNRINMRSTLDREKSL
jgi:hypothetical protein